MRSSLRPAPVERARPLLGTTVAVRASFARTAAAQAAIDCAFAEVAQVHSLMSFHDPASDLSRLNGHAAMGTVMVDPRTYEVLSWALQLAEDSEGCFDPTIAAEAVRAGALPRPACPNDPDPAASWRDIELMGEVCGVRFHRPLWIDLGGVAKGYAVDCAIAALRAAGAGQASVNAGGDLRVIGADAELIHLRCGEPCADALPILEVCDGAVASSGSGPDLETAGAVHIDGTSRIRVPRGRFATVVAPTCMAADALTKPVLARGTAPDGLLERYGATAHLYDHNGGWRSFGAHAA